MKRALILINAYSTSEAELNQPRRICEELNKRGVHAEIVRNGALSLTAELPYDYCVYLDKDKYLSRALEARGLRLFNSARAVELCDDKMTTFFALAGSGIALPKTMPAPLSYSPAAPVSQALLARVKAEFSFPLVVKECYGSLGKGVFLARDEGELMEIAARLKEKPHLFQEYIEESAGRDLRIIAIGGKAILAMKRSSAGDFRSNAALGGKGEPYEADAAQIACAERAAQWLGLDFCGVDLLFGRRGPILCEVNSNAFFQTAERVTGINVAGAYADYIVKETEK